MPEQLVKDIYWVDFYREAVSEMGLDAPAENTKEEGIHDKNWETNSIKGSLPMSSDMFLDRKP